MEKKAAKLLILYASQTGNALDAAERLGREAERCGCPVSILSLHHFNPSTLSSEETVIFVVSTTGQGDAPDSMKGFWTYLLQRSLSRHWLEGMHFAVFGLGDSGYQKYNFVAKKLDKRLSDLGGTAIIERGLGDDQHPSGYEGALDPWMSSLWSMLYQKDPKLFPNGPDFVTSDGNLIDTPKIQITFHASDGLCLQSSAEIGDEQIFVWSGVKFGYVLADNWIYIEADLKSLEMDIERTRSMSSAKFSDGRHRPDCFLKLVKKHPLTNPGCDKDVLHFEFDALSSSIEYKVGDVLEILPAQNPFAIDAFIERCNLDPESYIIVKPRDKEVYLNGTLLTAPKVPVNLKKFVELNMDVTSASPRRYFFEVMSYFASAPHEKERLQYFSSPEGRDDLYQYNQKERRTVVEVLEDFPSVQMPFEWLVQLTPPLKTRAFSIASSPAAHPNQVHLTVSIVSWTTPFKRKRSGLCSTWLASLDSQQRVYIPAWFHKGLLPSPQPSLPLILIGPGTGCAPFRGFVEQRAIQSKTCTTAPILFFFGCRNKENDFLYKDFWLSHSQNRGVLSEEKGGGFFVAFSRDQPQKVYVQHKMKEESARIWNLLGEGAAVYVAGSSNNMPADVLSAFEEIVAKEGGVPKADALRWLRALEKGGKYHVEAWS